LNGLKWTSDEEVIVKRSLSLSFEKGEKYYENGLKALYAKITCERFKGWTSNITFYSLNPYQIHEMYQIRAMMVGGQGAM